MKYIELTEDLRLGHPVLDAEHEKLVAQVNECVDIVKAGGEREAGEVKLAEISKFLCLHIQHEEAIMSELDYKITEIEKLHHLEGMQSFSALQDKLKNGMAVVDAVEEIKHLILVTFLRTDMGLKSYLPDI